ncbi:MAG: CpXC domain-containing protein [Anaerovoracaceae bacterium]|jgi:predicted RNA-binding Zn-ribbon protein involved in translation (DUF1610 family)
MAKYTEMTFVCPNCGREVDIPLLEAVDGVADIELKQMIVDGTFGIYECPECHDRMDINCQLTYHDGSRGLMVWVMPPELSGGEEEEIADENLLQTSAVLEQCAQRKVRDKNDLREKVLIAEAGRDDRIIELMKPGVYTALLDQVGERAIVAIYYERGDGEYFVVQLSSGEVGTIDFPQEMYEEIERRYGDIVRREAGGDEMRVIDNRWAADFVQKYMMEK